MNTPIHTSSALVVGHANTSTKGRSVSRLNRRDIMTALLVMSVAGTATADSPWPSRPVKIIVPFLAGSATDLLTRQVALGLSKQFDQQFVVEARPGAAGMLGSDVAARAKPDGYTLLMTGTGALITNRFLYAKMSYDPDEFEKIALIARTPLILLTRPGSPFSTVSELVAYAKANPRKLSYASFGVGTTAHLAGELLNMVAQIDLLHIPYKGSGEAIPALIGGQVDLYFDALATGLPPVSGGQLRALGVTTTQRSSGAPQVPTIAEQGYPGYDISVWFGLVAPNGTPPEVVAKLTAAVQKITSDPAFKKDLAAKGVDTLSGGPAEFASLMDAELKRIPQIIKQAGITPK